MLEEIFIEEMTKELDREILFLRKQNLLGRANERDTIIVTEDRTFFGPRKDFRFWQ